MYLILFPKKKCRKVAFLHGVYEYMVLSNLRLNPSLHFITRKWLAAAPRIGSSCRFRLRDPQPLHNGGRDIDNELSLYSSL